MAVVAVTSKLLRGVIAIGILGALALGGTAQAKVGAGRACKTVHGRYVSQMLPPQLCNSPVGMCTFGSLKGGLGGDYTFVMSTAIAAPDPDIPGVTFYTGTSHVALTQGGSVVGVDSGTIDLSPTGTGKQAALITIVGGTDGLEGSSGYLLLRGTLDLTTGEVSGDYEGEICTP